MTLILFFTLIYLANISDALVCYQCKGASMVSNALLRNLIDGLMQVFADKKRIDSPNIFCNNIDDLGVEKTCDPGSFCYSLELEGLGLKEKVAARSCVKQVQADTMECKEQGNEIYNLKQCVCNTEICNSKGTDNGNNNGNGNGNGNGSGNCNRCGNGKDD
jgi:hypothetical protein